MIAKNEAVAAKRRILIPFYDNDGALIAGLTFGTGAGEVFISKAGAAFVASAADVVAIGGGWYYLELSQAETNFDGAFILVKLVKATYRDQGSSDEMGGAVTLDVLAAALKINGKLDKTIYNSRKFLTSARWRIFATKAAADAATDGAADGAEGEIFRFLATGVDEGDGTVKTYEYARDL